MKKRTTKIVPLFRRPQSNRGKSPFRILTIITDRGDTIKIPLLYCTNTEIGQGVRQYTGKAVDVVPDRQVFDLTCVDGVWEYAPSFKTDDSDKYKL